MTNTTNITVKPATFRSGWVRGMRHPVVIGLVFSLLACSNNDGLDDLRVFAEAERAKKASAFDP